MSDVLNVLSDHELFLMAKRGNASAFEALYDRHAGGVARALISFAGPNQDALDDLTQDVFLRVINGLSSYVPSHPFVHWLYTITLNVGRNYARKQARIVHVDPSEFDSIRHAFDGTKDLSEEILTRELIRMAAELPIQMGEVVSLRIGSDMSYSEIAEVLGIPEGTARSRMHNAVKILREKIGIINTKRRTENG